jgi:hypothetical protein
VLPALVVHVHVRVPGNVWPYSKAMVISLMPLHVTMRHNTQCSAPASRQSTTTRQKAITQPKKVLILTMKLWKMALFAKIWLKKCHHSSNSGQKPEHSSMQFHGTAMTAKTMHSLLNIHQGV